MEAAVPVIVHQGLDWVEGMQWRRFTGWRFGVVTAASATFTVAIVNLVCLILAIRHADSRQGAGVGTLVDGNCSTVKNVSTWLHLGINAMSSLLLSASNFTQQCLAAPTREEIDVAHYKRDWLEIGVPGVRNLRKISWRRTALWLTLGLSSIPLHLIYNSVIFADTAVYNYRIWPTTFADLTDTNVTFSHNDKYTWLRENLDEFERMDNADCINAYGQPFVSNRGDVILVLDPETHSSYRNYGINHWDAVDATSTSGSPFDWMCFKDDDTCDPRTIAADDWNIRATTGVSFDFKKMSMRVEYCLSQPKLERCSLHYSSILLAVVVIFNLIKLSCMLLTVFGQKAPTLVTLGDAIASFLTRPDPATRGPCPLSENEIPVAGLHSSGPPVWTATRHRWFRSSSFRRWAATIFPSIIVLFAAVCLLSMGIGNISSKGGSASLKDLWDMGFGAVNVASLIDFEGGDVSYRSDLVKMVLIANLPQIVLSYLYLGYNALWTYMLIEREFNSFLTKRKGLRVTTPKGAQRSTYWLSLPKRLAVPLIMMSALLHWLVSQSIFLVRLTAYNTYTIDRQKSYERITTCGYSAISLIFVIIVGSLMIVFVLAAGYRRFEAGAPILNASSTVISAACHMPQEDEYAALQPIMWGEVKMKGLEGLEGEIGHCCFSSFEVEPPVLGKKYI